MSILLKEQDGAILYLTLNRPERRNAITVELGQNLAGAFRTASADPSVNVIVLTGAGSAFCGGADVNEVKALPDHDAKMRHVQMTASLLLIISTLDIPVLAAVNGPAVGAGAGLALSADGIVMAQNATLNFPELAHGMVPALVLPGLQRQLGRLAAFDVLTRGKPITAALALEQRWINTAVPAEHLMSEVHSWAQKLAAIPRDLVVATKRLANRTVDMPLADGIAAAVQTWR